MKSLTKLLFPVLVVFFATASADQNSPELESLFEALQETSDPAVGATISREIWRYWYQSDNDEIDELMQKGESSMAETRLDDAVEYFTEIIRINPEFAEGWNRRATAYYLMGQYVLSTADVQETLKLEPRHYGALSGQGLIYMRLDENRKAIEYMERALEMNPHMLGVRQTIDNLKKSLEDEVI